MGRRGKLMVQSVGVGNTQTGEELYYRSSATCQSQAHALGSPAQESCTRNTAPGAFGFEGQQES